MFEIRCTIHGAFKSRVISPNHKKCTKSDKDLLSKYSYSLLVGEGACPSFLMIAFPFEIFTRNWMIRFSL